MAAPCRLKLPTRIRRPGMNQALILAFCGIVWFGSGTSAAKAETNLIESINDMKDFKKIMKTKTNVLVMFTNSESKSKELYGILGQVSKKMQGIATVAYVNCAVDNERKKMCKKLKATPTTHVLKHYKNGQFNKDYDRKERLSSILNFLDDPTGDLPWEEDDQAVDVVHVADATALEKLLRKESRPILVMFYAPWCGYCKRMKPPYAEAATELSRTHVLAAMDVNKPENNGVREALNITGFPTTILFEKGRRRGQYNGDATKDAIVTFMKDPAAAMKKPQKEDSEPPWSEEESQVVHLEDGTFDTFMSSHERVMVMFYAPWCGHCKKMKPEYTAAAAQLARDHPDLSAKLAAVDATKEEGLGKRYSVKGYPTVKYFEGGEEKWDLDNVRTKDKIVDFMLDPSEPPPPPPPEPSWADKPDTLVDHLTADNFVKHLKKKKHCLVMFYAPWCGHCKAAKPEFESVAAHYAEEARVSVAAVDCTEHSEVCSQYDVQGYPTIKYFSYLDKHQQDYTGPRKSDDFISFLASPNSDIEWGSAKTEL